MKKMLNFLKGLTSSTKKEEKVSWSLKYDEIEFIFPEQAVKNLTQFAKRNDLFLFQNAYLKYLESNYDVDRFPNGFALKAEILPELGEDFRALFEMPPYFNGKYVADIYGNTAQSHFDLKLKLQMPDGSTVSSFQLEGSFLRLTQNERYFLTPAEYQALKTLNEYRKLPAEQRTEFENNWLIFNLQQSKKAGMPIDLSHFNQDRIDLISPDSVGVSITALPNGDIEISPTIKGINPKDIPARIGGLKNNRILKVGNKFVLFSEERFKAIEEICPLDEKTGQRQPLRIRQNQVEKFWQNPTAWLDSQVVNLEMGFSLRVFGAEKFVHKYFGDREDSGIDWLGGGSFIHSPDVLMGLINTEQDLEETKTKIQNAMASGADVIDIDGHLVDISNNDEVEGIIEVITSRLTEPEKPSTFIENAPSEEDVSSETSVVGIIDNDEESRFERFIKALNTKTPQPFNVQNLKRQPYPHQEEGIHWILSHLYAIEREKTESGALLADDMGLGKTYMSLVAVAEYYRHQTEQEKVKKPVLVVAPLSLLENWKDEIDKTFHQSPFNDVVILQDNGLKPFKLGGKELKQKLADDIAAMEDIRYSLKVGKEYVNERLDMPARLVLTTYDTLRNYQFSLCLIDWGMVIFDEAQNLKNPNTIVSRAAKGLKAEFKLLATGTPVENSLRDFWCLMDTATPGLFGAWKTFSNEYIKPILDAKPEESEEIKNHIGKILRQKVGQFMLRRTKAEKLEGLPNKMIYSGYIEDEHYLPFLAAEMHGVQLKKYNDIISNVRKPHNNEHSSHILTALRELKVSSIHPNLGLSNKELIDQTNLSSKMLATMQLLKEIQQRNEKVLIFAESRRVQTYLIALMLVTFGLNCDVINGETTAVSTSGKKRTRKAIIDEFEAKEGFNILIMSPIAAGVGLTIVGANNVIHLERHWNPAKEAQATDRVYRIGQTKQVNVYLPMAIHPNMASFDIQLHRLLNKKIDLSNAIVANPNITPDDLGNLFS